MEKKTVGIAGLGLIGGSFARDLVALDHGVIGYDIDEQTCTTAMELGVVHQAATNPAILDDAEAILIAVPVGNIATVMQAIAKLAAHRLQAVFDAGSTKLSALANASLLGKYAHCYVACHPIAGAEHCGVRNSAAGLFHERQLIMCDLPDNENAVALTKELWQACGAQIKVMEAAEHDRIFATVSHLPHMLAYALVGMLGSRDERDLLLSFAASGFADFTRIASSDPSMWRDVCLTNKENLVAQLQAYRAELDQLCSAIASDDGSKLHDYFERARELRNNWLKQ